MQETDVQTAICKVLPLLQGTELRKQLLLSGSGIAGLKATGGPFQVEGPATQRVMQV